MLSMRRGHKSASTSWAMPDHPLYRLPLHAHEASMLRAPGGWALQVSDVRPLLTVATYLDDQTGFEIYQEVGGGDWG